MSDPNLMNDKAGNVASPGGGNELNPHAGVLKYPLNLGEVHTDTQNFILFHAKPGGPRNRGNSGTGDSSDIALHIPPGSMKTKFTGNFTPLTGGALYESSGRVMGAGMVGGGIASAVATRFKGVAAVVGVLAGVGMNAIGEGWSKGGDISEAVAEGIKNLPDDVKEFATSAGALAIANFGSALQPIAAMEGVGINPHIAMVYQGPGAFRTHDMTFDFWPRNYAEAIMVRNIVQTFKRRMLPKMHNFLGMNSVYFNFPHEFFIDFYIGTTSGPQRFDQMGIRRSVLSSMDINFDASAAGPSFYDNPAGDPLPVHTKLSLVFQETEFILENTDLMDNSTSDKVASDKPAPTIDNPAPTGTNYPGANTWNAAFRRARAGRLAGGKVNFMWEGGDGHAAGEYHSYQKGEGGYK
jgi:hypothetical protein